MSHPKLPSYYLKFFKWFCDPGLFNELQGDLEEAFYDNTEKLGVEKAKAIYRKEVIRMIRPSVMHIPKTQLHSKFNQINMFRNYFKTSYRSLMKNPMSSFINIFGLSAAIGICVFVYGYAQWTYRTDQFHEHKNEVYLTTFFADRDGSTQQIGTTPRPLGEMLKNDLAQIKEVCRLDYQNVIVKKGNNVYYEQITYVDPSFLDMFTFPLKWGTSASLTNKQSIILSETMAVKYFGQENPIGSTLQLKVGEGQLQSFNVTGVAAPFPASRSFSFQFLVNYNNAENAASKNWGDFTKATFIQVSNIDDLVPIEEAMDKYQMLQNAAIQSDWLISSFAFEPLATMNVRSESIRDDVFFSQEANYSAIMFLKIMAGFLMALACFNYINIAIVTAAKRLKEIGLRKVTGASSHMIVVQFLLENMFLTSIAMVVGLVIGISVFIPWFEGMFGFSMGFQFWDLSLMLYLLVILLGTGIISGIYPAFYISRFQVVSILKGTVRFEKKNPLTRVLLTIQLILCAILITSAIMFSQNNEYIAERSWGYEQANVIYTKVQDYPSYQKMSLAMLQNPNVIAVSGSEHHLGKGHHNVIIDRPDRGYEVSCFSVGDHYFETMGIQLVEGRYFKADHKSDIHSVIVNELLVTKLGLVDPIGQTFKIDSVKYEVVGVVKDFHSASFSSVQEASIFKLAPSEDYRYLTMKIRAGTEIETFASFHSVWDDLFTEIPFEGGHQEDVWGEYFLEIENHGKFWRGVAFIAVLLAGLGLYGLVTLNVLGRRKEFSIRKILGAKSSSVAVSISRQYFLLFVIAFMIGMPLSYFFMDFMLDFAYEYHIPMSLYGVLSSVMILIMVLVVTIASQVVKVSKSNPVIGLRAD